MTIMKVQRKFLIGRLFLCRYRCSTVLRWDTFTDDNYDLDKASDLLTRYPIAVDANDSTLDHLISAFVIGITAIILALVACSAYGRVRQLKETKQRYKRPSSEETRSLL